MSAASPWCAFSFEGYSRVSASTTTFFAQGRAGDMKPEVIAWSTAVSGGVKMCVGRLWHSMQSMGYLRSRESCSAVPL